ncbi:MAG: helix-turn-helix domain-containing protein [Pseudomonadota bacterium]
MSTRKSAAIEEARYSAPALEKGLDMLELLAAEPQGRNLQEIARRLERTPNELFRMLDVLVRRGYLARQPDSAYVLTLRLFELAHRHPGVDRLLDCAMPHISGTRCADRTVEPPLRAPRCPAGRAGAGGTAGTDDLFRAAGGAFCFSRRPGVGASHLRISERRATGPVPLRAARLAPRCAGASGR